MDSLKNKTVLVTGGSRGIGEAIALSFARAGANVIINYNQSHTKAEMIVQEIENSGGKAIAVKADISDFEQAKSLVEKGIEVFGNIDVLVNNSGITKDNMIIRMSEDDFDSVIEVNLKGTWNMCKHISRYMLKNKAGSIINITSIVGVIGNPGQSNYVASKAGIIGLTKSLSKELGSRGITVNAVAPGFIETEMTDKLPVEIKEAYLKQIPLSRFGKADDIADLCLFLASDNARYITGQVIGVNGGMI